MSDKERVEAALEAEHVKQLISQMLHDDEEKAISHSTLPTILTRSDSSTTSSTLT